MNVPSRFLLSVFIGSLVCFGACSPSQDAAPEAAGLRDISELMERRSSPPYFQLKAGCRLPDMGFEAGYTQLKVSMALAEKDMSRIVLKSEQNANEYGRLGFWEDHTTPESNRIKSLDGLYLVERNLSAIDNKTVREIVDTHCNKGAVYGGVVSNIPPNLGSLPDRLVPKAPIIIDPRPKFPTDLEPTEPDLPTVDPHYKSLLNPVEENRYGLIACFELKKVRKMYVVDRDVLMPWLAPKDGPICSPMNWDEFKDSKPMKIIIE